MNSMIWITIFLFLAIMSATLNDKENQAADNQPLCLPFKALFVWHTGSAYGHSFVQQKRLITTVIHEGLPEGTDISLVTVGAKMTTKFHFIKNTSDESWIDKLEQRVPGKSEKYGIPYLELSNAVYNHFDMDENPKMAEEVFLLVNNKSVIDETLKAVEVLEKKKTYVIIYGKQTSGDVLTNLATDNRHVIGLGDSYDSINDAAKSILNLSCQDSKLVCDTDKYWNGKSCYTCTYVCSPEAWKLSKYCYDACPYYEHTQPDKVREVDHSVNDYSWTAAIYSRLNTILLSLIIFALVIKFRWKRTSLKEKIRRFCRKRKTPERRSFSSFNHTTKIVQQDDNAHEVLVNEGEDDIVIANGDKYNTKGKDQVEQKKPNRHNKGKNESLNDDGDRPDVSYVRRLPEPPYLELLMKSEDKSPEDKL